MSDSNQTENSELKKLLGILFLLLAFAGGYWIVFSVIQLWNTPRNVPFVNLFIELVQENQLPALKSKDGTEVNLPDSWPVIVGIFLSIVLLSSVGLLVRSLFSNSLLLLFPELAKGRRNQKEKE